MNIPEKPPKVFHFENECIRNIYVHDMEKMSNEDIQLLTALEMKRYKR